MAEKDHAEWLNQRLQRAKQQVEKPQQQQKAAGDKWFLGIDLGTCNVVSMVVDQNANPIATLVDEADVVRDGIVWNFFGAVEIIRQHLSQLQQLLGVEFTHAATSYPPGTDPRISVNVLEAAGLEVSKVIDEPSAVAQMLNLTNSAVVDIGGGTTGVAVIKNGNVIYSGDEPTGGYHVTLVLAGSLKISRTEAENKKRSKDPQVWPIVRPVFEKMVTIVQRHLTDYPVKEIFLSGGSCSLNGVEQLFKQSFAKQQILLPNLPLFITPLAIAVCAMEDNHVD